MTMSHDIGRLVHKRPMSLPYVILLSYYHHGAIYSRTERWAVTPIQKLYVQEEEKQRHKRLLPV